MAARVLCARPEFSFRSFFNRTKEILTEAGYCISDSCGNLQRIELLQERLLEARETVFVLRQRATEFGPGPAEPGDLEMDNFCRDMAELSNNLSSAKIQFPYEVEGVNTPVINLPLSQQQLDYLQYLISTSLDGVDNIHKYIAILEAVSEFLSAQNFTNST